MFKFKPDIKRENESLWGDEQGYEHWLKSRLKPSDFPR